MKPKAAKTKEEMDHCQEMRGQIKRAVSQSDDGRIMLTIKGHVEVLDLYRGITDEADPWRGERQGGLVDLGDAGKYDLLDVLGAGPGP